MIYRFKKAYTAMRSLNLMLAILISVIISINIYVCAFMNSDILIDVLQIYLSRFLVHTITVIYLYLRTCASLAA